MSTTLSEAESKNLLAQYNVPIPGESLVHTPTEAAQAAEAIGYPVVAKLGGAAISHKTERGLVKLNLRDAASVTAAATELLAKARPEDGEVHVLIAQQVSGIRELIAGVIRDPQFGPCVMMGIGGVLAEAINDVAFRPAPLSRNDALALIEDLRSQALFGPLRGEPAINTEQLATLLIGLGQLAVDRPDIASIDVNPLIVCNGTPIAVDGLVELYGPGQQSISQSTDQSIHRSINPNGISTAHGNTSNASPTRTPNTPDPATTPTSDTTDENFRSLFEPRGVIVAGASSHPGKFGFSALHNILASGYQGQVFATNREAEIILGIQTLRSITEIPNGAADLVIVCTPASTNVGMLRECAAKGVKAAFITSAGYREAGPEGAAAEAELIAVAHELGMLVAGPNGQGMISTPASLCAMIVAPYPVPGRISIASQSGNLLSSFMNYSLQSGIGMARGISAGNAACVSVGDYLSFFGTDEATAVALAYVENVDDGVGFVRQLRAVSERKPVVLVKGGATAAGSAAAASHTGALASVDRVFDGAIRSAGVVRAANPEEAYDIAASFATQPLPKGPNVAVITTAGGWGVVTADALAGTALNLMTLPDDLRDQIDKQLPPRWSRANPIDMAGGETRETIPAVLEMVASHPDVHAIVYLGLGIQSNTARMMRAGEFYPEHGTKRIVDFHERQDRIYALAAAEISARHGKPILTATELGIADPNNVGPIAVRESGRYCYPSSQRAVRALAQMWWYAQWRARRNLPLS